MLMTKANNFFIEKENVCSCTADYGFSEILIKLVSFSLRSKFKDNAPNIQVYLY